jgi:acetamidase/formamidase
MSTSFHWRDHMSTYVIEPEGKTLHGTFSREFEPVVTIDSGDSVIFSTLDARWGLGPRETPEDPRLEFEPRDPKKDSGHALCGPVAIRGAEPGMTLAIRINELRPGKWGWNYAGGLPSEVNRRLGMAEEKQLMLDWELDADAMTGRNHLGHTVALRPFMGVMGMPPDEPGLHSTTPPRFCGGNIDCKELVPGSTLYLPIAVRGGLFSVGDGHGAQGDGEVSGVAIECPMERVDLTFFVRDDLQLTMPRANTPAGWITFGFHEDLNEATFTALEGMLQLMGEIYGFERKEALALASVVVDLRITQIVNGVRGVHAILPHGAIK